MCSSAKFQLPPLLGAKGFNSSAGCLIDLLLMGRSAAADAAERV